MLPSNLLPTKSSSSSSSSRQRKMSLVTEDMKAKAEVYHGDATCREKFMLLLAGIGLPIGLLTIQEIEECGYVKEIGFVWLKHKERRKQKFENVVVVFDTEVTAYFEQNKIKNLTGVRAKEFLVWISLREIYVNDYDSPNAAITFMTPVGLSKSFPISLFQVSHDCKEIKRSKQKSPRRTICAGKV